MNELTNEILTNWVGPLVLAAIAVFALIFLKDRAWMKLISFVGIAAVVAVLVYGGSALFGPEGSLTQTGEYVAGTIGSDGAPSK